MTLTTEEVLRAFWRAFNAHDLDALLSLLDEDVVLNSIAAPEPIVGKARVGAAWYLMFTFVTPDLHKEVEWTSIGDCSGAFEVTEHGTLQVPAEIHRADNPQSLTPRPYELKMAVHFNLSKEGRICRIATYWDTGSLARQIGLDVETLAEIHRKAIGGTPQYAH